MKKIKKLFETPKRAVLSIMCIIAILAILGTAAFLVRNAMAEKASNAAFADAGLEPSSVKFVHTEFDFEYGTLVCEVDFISNGTEYDYLVKVFDGTIIKKEIENNGNTYGNNKYDNSTNQSQQNEQIRPDTAKNTENPDTITDSESYIGVENAKSIAVSHAGFSVTDVNFSKAKLEMDDGQTVYEVDFYKDGMEYEYTIHATTGSILEYDMD